jgi:hypothetical protein
LAALLPSSFLSSPTGEMQGWLRGDTFELPEISWPLFDQIPLMKGWNMRVDAQSRRHLLTITACALAASSVVAPGTKAFAYQGNMERALSELQTALQSLREATPDKGGHKATAVRLIEQAVSEVQAGIDFAAKHFGD